MSYLTLVVFAIFVQNIIFTKALGITLAVQGTSKPKQLFVSGLLLTVILTLSATVSYFPAKLFGEINLTMKNIMVPFVFSVSVALISVVLLFFARWRLKKHYALIFRLLPLVAFDSAVFGILLLTVKNVQGFLPVVLYSIASGVGFVLASFILSGIYHFCNGENTPAAFRGLPATLIYIGIISMTFYAFSTKILF